MTRSYAHRMQDSMMAQRDALRMLYNNNMSGIVVSMAASFALCFGFYSGPTDILSSTTDTTDLIRLTWWVVISAVLLIRLADLFYWRSQLQHTNFSVRPVRRRFMISTLTTACLWSVYAVVMTDRMGLTEYSATAMVIACLVGGACMVLSADKTITTLYTVILIVPFSVYSLTNGEDYKVVTGLLGLFFCAVMLTSARRASAFTTEAIVTKNQNSQLLSQMEQKTQEIATSNSSLEEIVRRRTQRIFDLSNIDPLTKLNNRTAFSSKLQQLFDRANESNTSVALLFIDLDYFKSINDTLGHHVGDTILKTTAERLSCFTHNDSCIGRWGGDEFLLACKSTNIEETKALAGRLIKALSQPIHYEQSMLTVGSTIGISLYPDYGTTVCELIQQADTAMYVQKKTSKSNVSVFSLAMKEALVRENRIKEGLVHALSNDSLSLVYQPIVDLKTGNAAAFEALVRWEHESHSISPSEFIPVAEKHGLIHEIGELVLETACNEAAAWQHHLDAAVSVNLSIAQFMREDFVDLVVNILNRSGLPANKLHLEITESVYAENHDIIVEQVRNLQLTGIKISIDDFGTGFSSLSQVQQLSADIIKIDKSFINTMDDGGKVIIEAIKYIAEKLNYLLIAEGVETQAEVDALRAIGIQYIQGYYYSKPLTAELLSEHYLLSKKAV